MNYKVSHPTKVVECEIDLPSSKSISNRLLIIKTLCEGAFQIKNLSDSEDTISLQKALNSTRNVIDVVAAGTSFRFLTAFFSTIKGEEFVLTGSERMKNRPIKNLVDSLRDLGAKIEYVEKKNFPPLKITGQYLKGGKIQTDGGVSSQFISALLLIAPTLKNGLEIEIIGDIVSIPYIEMTLSLMKELGVPHLWNNNIISIQNQEYIAKDYVVESDWSAASFWFEIAALSDNCKIKLNGLSENSIQGDKKVMELYEKLGVYSTFEEEALILTKKEVLLIPETIDLLETPDLYQPLKCTLFGLGKDSKLSGLATLKDKETNRIKAVENELLKMDSTKIIETYKDHRMAMSFAPLSLISGEFQINDVEVVNKSYPNFWEDLKKGSFKITPLIPTNN
ncbi:MAG: 3-phosphoshikimate 1-carboxyvinyltransferase [Bacteroidota bacterium]|nr:3-phosphoshikimate 1-carboxyvinyltransferase [Bacteroidota bacterium]